MRHRITITFEVPYEAQRRKSLRAAGWAIHRASVGEQAGADGP